VNGEIERTVATVKGRVPILIGVGGNDTRKVVKAVKRLERHDVQGILSVCPTTTGRARTACASTSRAWPRPPTGRSSSTTSPPDAYFYTMLAHRGAGGILASAHVETATFLGVYERMAANDHRGALKAWSRLEPMVPLLFKEPNPAPIKHCLWRQGLIASAECRLPLTRVSDALARELAPCEVQPCRRRRSRRRDAGSEDRAEQILVPAGVAG
jgi:4-hydroxy-tetrahydrodipicolinate synthase